MSISSLLESSYLDMGRNLPTMRLPKLRSWQRCSRKVREQRTRLYIIWRCTVILLRWDE
ncbi:hypothetical protein Peur_056072 [Populus x canadensis]